jgi:hypothetical protein
LQDRSLYAMRIVCGFGVARAAVTGLGKQSVAVATANVTNVRTLFCRTIIWFISSPIHARSKYRLLRSVPPYFDVSSYSDVS